MDRDRPTSGTTKVVGEGFNGKRLRKLQLERAQSSSVTFKNKEERNQDAFRRWSSMNETINGLKSENRLGDTNSGSGSSSMVAAPAAGAATTSSRPKYPNNPFVYVLPEPKKIEPKDLLLSSSLSSRADSAGGKNGYPRDRYATMKDEVPPDFDLAYPHGMPRWGPRLVTRTSLEEESTTATSPRPPQVEDTPLQAASNRVAATSHTTTATSNITTDDTESPPLNDDHNHRKPKQKHSRAAKKAARQNEVLEKAKAQSVMAATRAIQNIASASPGSLPKLVGSTDIGQQRQRNSRLWLGGRPTLLQSARVKQARRVMKSAASGNSRQAMSVDHDDSDEPEQEDNDSAESTIESEVLGHVNHQPGTGIQVETVESESDNHGSVTSSDGTNDDDDNLSIDDSVSYFESEEEDDDETSEEDVHHFHSTSTPKKEDSISFSAGNGFTSRLLFGRQQPKTLLQSARIKQAHVVMRAHGCNNNFIRKARSLDDSLQREQQRQQQQQQQKHHNSNSNSNDTPAGARSVQSFEFLQSSTTMPTATTTSTTTTTTTTKRKYEPIKVETVESDSEEDGDDECGAATTYAPVKVETVESDSEEDEDDECGASPTFIVGNSSPASAAIDEDQNFGPRSVSHSWSMKSSSDDAEEDPLEFNNSNDDDHDAELSIDETIGDSTGASNREPELEEISKQPRTPQSLSIPTLILSEVDPESSSRLSDCSSSLAQPPNSSSSNTVPGNEEDEEFFDAEGSLRTSSRDRPFDAKRCRELLKLRNKYLEEEERSKLLSPEAASRLSSIPSLFRGARETTLLELATRGRWLERNQANNQTPETTTIMSSPFSAAYPRRQEPPLASMPDYDGPGFQPISLVAPAATLSKPLITRKEPWHVASAGDNKADQKDGNAYGPPRSGVTNATTPFKTRIRRFLLRCLYYLLFLLWATRTSFRLRDKFVSSVNIVVVVLNEESEVSQLDVPHTNASKYTLPPGTTHTRSSWNEMPIILYDPPKLEVVVFPGEVQETKPTPVPPQKCFANTTMTIKKFWEFRLIAVRDEVAEDHVDDHDFIAEDIEPKGTNDETAEAFEEALFLASVIQDQTLCDDHLAVCYVTPESTYPSTEQFGPLHVEDNTGSDLSQIHLAVSTDYSKQPVLAFLQHASEIQHVIGTNLRPFHAEYANQEEPQAEEPSDGFNPSEAEDNKMQVVVEVSADPSQPTIDETRHKVPLLKGLGDMLRRRGQQLQERRQKLRAKLNV